MSQCLSGKRSRWNAAEHGWLAVDENSVIQEAETSLGRLASYQLRAIELAGLEAQRESAGEQPAEEPPVEGEKPNE